MTQNMFISYATEYDLYEGRVGIGSLTSEQQDFLIKATFSNDSDVRDFVVKNNIIKKQAEGLWSIVVLIGMALEYARLIRNFEQRTDNDIQKIIGELAGTNLWLRLEEAYPPFDTRSEKTPYDWRELEVIGGELFQNLAGEQIGTVRAGLHKVLSTRKVDAKFDTRMPFEQFKRLLNEGKIAVYQDRMLAAVAASSGVVKSNSAFIFIAALATLIATPFLWYFFSFYVGVATFIGGIVLFKLARSSLRNAVYMAGMSDKGKYRWLMSRRVLWVVWKN